MTDLEARRKAEDAELHRRNLVSDQQDQLPLTARKARCIYCGKPKPVTKAGRIRKHYVTGGPTTTTAGQRVVCGGSGRPA